MRIFIGLTEITHIASELRAGLEEMGHEVYVGQWYRNHLIPDQICDCVLSEVAGVTPEMREIPKQMRLYSALAKRLPGWIHDHDLFIFIYAHSFLPGNLDFPLLKLFGKKVISIFCGTDIRYWHAYQQEMRMYGLEEVVAPFLNAIRGNPIDRYSKKLRRVRMAERYADALFAQPSYAQLLVRPYWRLNLPMELSRYRFHVPNREVPLIVHAPSHRGVKGTTEILQAVELLRAEGVRFEFRLIENLPNQELLKLLSDADIVIDTLISAIIGRLALEGMATGNAVLGRYMPEYAHVPEGCPMVVADRFTIADRLREVIVDRDLRAKLAQAGRPYVENYFERKAFVKKVLLALEEGKTSSAEIMPAFYKDHYVRDADLYRKEFWRLLRSVGKVLFE